MESDKNRTPNIPSPWPEYSLHKKSGTGTNIPWTPVEEQRLRFMRDAGDSWDKIARVTK